MKCGHTICSTCYESVLRTTIVRVGEKKKCPICKEELDTKRKTKNFNLEAALMSLKAKCKSCDKEGSLEHINIHECPNDLITCPNKSCSVRTERRNLQAHTSTCEHRTINCNLCVKTFEARHGQQHLSSCMAASASCPFGCTEELSR